MASRSPGLYPRCFLPALTALLILGTGGAATASSGKDYVARRNHLHCDRQLTYDRVQAQPANYVGRVLELRGKVCGTMETNSGLSAMLDQSDKSALTLDIPKSEIGPFRDSDTPHVRILAKVEDGSSGNVVVLTVLAVANDSEVSAIEQAAAARLAAQRSVNRVRYRTATTVLPWRSSTTRSTLTPNVLAELAGYYDRYLGPRVKPLFQAYCSFIAAYNPRLSADMAALIATSLLHFADQYNVDPRLAVAMIIAESGFDPHATSRTGAMGLGQLMPGTARALGVSDPYDPKTNLEGSINYLRSRLDTFADKALPGGGLSEEQAEYALAAYNAGVNAVRKYGRIPPYRETQAYVRRVMVIFQWLCQ
jgi:soluble lytic murein transglycosylase-like protein